MKKVAMIGVGKLGQPCAEVMAQHYDVTGYDVDPKNPIFPMKPTIEEAVKDRDLIFIAAPTPHDPIYGGETPTSHLPVKDFDYSITIDILKEVNKHVNQNQLVVLISTVLPGTVRNVLRQHITNARFIYNPYLIAMGTVAWDFINPEMVIIGTDDGSLTGDAKELIDFYKPMMQNDPRYEVGTWDEAESIKIFYNTFISTKLALVNMIQDVAEANGNIDVDVVTNALKNSTYRIMGPAYMKAGMGDAGACHPRDNIALRYLAERLELGYDLFDSIMHAREVQSKKLAEKCLQYGKKVTIIGKAYKPRVPYLNGSASMLVGHYIEELGGTVHYYDLNTGDTDLKLDDTDVYLFGYWEEWVHNIDWTHAKKSYTFVDPWRTMPILSNHRIVHYGNTRKTDAAKENYQEWRGDDIANVRLNGGVFVKYPRKLDGGGLNFKDDLVDVVRKTGKYSYNRAYEWCAGFGVLGYELLGMGICNHIVFSDMYKDAIDNCIETAKSNNLVKYVTTYHSNKVGNIPTSEKWDLVISNPPHCDNLEQFKEAVKTDYESDPKNLDNSIRLCVDENYEIHKEFFTNIKNHLTLDADVYLIEAYYSENMIHMAKFHGLRLVGKHQMKDKTMPQGVILHFKPN